MSNQIQTAGEEFTPAKEMVINSLEMLKVAADPTRLRILEVLTERPLTVKQIAGDLETTPTKLYYHINLLEEKGLIVVTGSRIVSGIIEKQYRTAATSMRVDRELLAISGTGDDGGVDALLSVVFDAARNDVLQGIKRGIIKLAEDDPAEQNTILMRTITRLTPERFQDFRERFGALLKEFNAMDSEKDEDPTALTYGLTVALYPFPHADVQEDDTSGTAHWNLD
ncbi:MAG: winged helix-turn-helix domain-containing protein [Chloroflexota bacterium]